MHIHIKNCKYYSHDAAISVLGNFEVWLAILENNLRLQTLPALFFNIPPVLDLIYLCPAAYYRLVCH